MTTPNFEYTCYHCGSKCGGRLETGYGALTGEFTPDGAIHASCHPDNPATHPDCWRRVQEFGEPAGTLRGVDPKPVGVEDIRTSISPTFTSYHDTGKQAMGRYSKPPGPGANA